MSGNLEKYQSRNPVIQLLVKRLIRTVILTGKTLAPDSILDVGCGEGFIAANLLTVDDSGLRFKYVGVDLSYETLKTAEKIHYNLRGRVSQGDIYNLPFNDQTFDVVIATEILEHLNNPERALLELERVSARWVLLSVPKEPFFRIGNLLRGKNLTRWGNDPEHVQWWSTRGFVRFISARLRVRKVQVVFPWTVILAEINENY